MAYQGTLSGNQTIAIANQNKQTQITLMSSSAGQQQSQSTGMTTGAWTKPPQLFDVGQGFILQINGEQQQYFIQIQANSINTINGIPALQNATVVELREVDDTSTPNSQGFSPMQPMQPMKMGNMSMDINSMSMQMGNMSLNLGKQSQTNQASTAKVFCSQCGVEAKAGDRFCRSCGHDLNQ